jgi:8-oxo-dGTP pyrophosphatase MutT (NUDIX family)
MANMVKPWNHLDSQPLGDYAVFRLRRDRNQSADGAKTGDFYVLEAPAWINVIPVTRDGEVVLIRQYRHGTREITLEIPGGMTDPEDASPAAAARRELREETGYDCEALIQLGALTPNPAIQDNHIYTFLAAGAFRDGPQELHGNEEIDLELHDLSEIPELVRTGRIDHALVVAAFYLLSAFRGDRSGVGQELD